MANNNDDLSETIKIREEYETQYFGFTVESLISGIESVYSTVCSDVTKELTEFLKSKNDKIDAEHAAIQLNAKYSKKTEDSMIKIRSYLEQCVFNIPSTIVLPEDEVQLQYPTADDRDLEVNKNQQLVKKIKDARYMIDILKKQQDSSSENLQDYNELVETFKSEDKHQDLCRQYLSRKRKVQETFSVIELQMENDNQSSNSDTMLAKRIRLE